MAFARHARAGALFALASLAACPCLAAPAVALGYTPRYPADFQHFDYVDPAAPKGGTLTLGAIGGFDRLNPFVLKGTAAAGVSELACDTLGEQSRDEPFSIYGLLARDIELEPDRLAVTFTLDPRARFSDGSAVTAEDVKATFDALKGPKAHPQYRVYWADVTAAEVLDARHVRFRFARVNPELHLIIAQMPVFAARWVEGRNFDDIVLEAPLCSGPYVVDKFTLGRSITYRRNPEYWARDLPVRKGQYNFDRVTFEYYQDAGVALEGFKAGEFDLAQVNVAKQWVRDYVGPKFDSGELLKRELAHHNNAGMQGFVFNLRRPLFRDVRVRRALALAFDFEWSNQNLFFGLYRRSSSYFANSELAATDVPSGAELALLEPLRSQLPPALFTQPWRAPSTEAPGSLRDNLRAAQALLAEAGWTLQDEVLVKDGQRLEFEALLENRAFERVFAAYAKNLQRLGVRMNYRTVDGSLYQRRVDIFDFDLVVHVYAQSQSPGNEQIGYWHSSMAAQEGSNNLMGLRDPVVDALVEKLVYAQDRAQLVAAAHALDRVLLWGEYVVPNWHSPVHRIAYRDRFGMPKQLPLYYQPLEWALSTWWAK
ncbi:microcin C transport system substrate-binding protein [Plasticicumulans lactativorans]|uniref:Microcin C transport system substrate-binding protein n=1 Tax=Plasticicumulans lactativorans TaxID=1133106 RepID=A0A4R2LFB1_9GAMM|nr:extracellular solute-binding protein [Plasticicumulans lactativorans]TCO83457.1 microcin C transport system substrate-binding protein [Plasticicumulans lactativorans]